MDRKYHRLVRMLPGDIPRLHPANRTAIEAEDRAWTYGEIDALADRFAAFFTAEGLPPGDRVSLFCVNEPAMAAAYFGAFRARVVANPINHRLLPEEAAYILDHAGSRCVVVSDEFVPVIEQAVGMLSSPPVVLKLSTTLSPALGSHTVMLAGARGGGRTA